MQNHRIWASSVVGIIIGGFVALILTLNTFPFELTLPNTPYTATSTHASGLASEFGVNGGVPSLSSDSSKQTAINDISDAGFGWMRHEFTYANPVDFAPYDAANSKAKAAGIKTLGLLAYPGSGKTHDDWKTFVNSVVGHYGSDISAWEIMNEIDNSLSASDYVSYLTEAHDIIKGINPNATIVLSGLTSRQEATSYWDGVAAAGGWGEFDKIGLHVYHSGYPEKVNFGGGDLVGELDRVVGDINKNGGGKKIWITEMGYASGSEGNTNQANWLARSLIMSRSVSALEKIFIYHLYDGGGDTYGLLTSSLAQKPAFGEVKSAVGQLAGKGTTTKLAPQQKTTLDNFDSVSGWNTDGTSNGTTTLSSDSGGYSGNAMKIAYTFNQDSAYAMAEKKIAISGTPTALAAWIYGDDTKNVWKLRFIDANGETFQADLGSIPSGWNYKQFTFGQDTAFTSWNGNGVIDFPITFDSFVIDHQGGSSSASGKIDELIAVTGGADLEAFTFSGNVAFWKITGTATATLCGAARDFREDPQYATADCSDTPVSSSPAGPSSSPSSTPAKKKVVAAAPAKPKVIPDVTKSTVRLDGTNIPADDHLTYHVVTTLKDSSGNLILDQKPDVFLSGGQTTTKDEVLIGPEWILEVSSNAVGDRTATVKVGGLTIGTVTMTFVPVTKPTAPQLLTGLKPAAASTSSNTPVSKTTYYAIMAVGAILAGLLLFLRKRILSRVFKLHRRE